MPAAGKRWILLSAALVALASLPSDAVADRAFGPRFTVNTQGDITIAANSLESCLDALPACAGIRNAVGGAVSANNNNDRTMTWIDADTDPATFNSSSADLALPAGARVLFAGLYYGGKLTAGNGGSPPPNPGARNTVRLKAPGDTAYRTVTASQIDESSTQYQGFANVTAIVDGAGPGTYWTANVQLGTGSNSGGQLGGWSLVVAYGDPNAPSRNLSIFDGMQNVSGAAVTIPLSGFQTPLSGPVTSTVGIVTYEGDLGILGDGAQLQGPSGAFTALSNAVNPGPPATSASNSNVFNSTISNAGVLVTSRLPSYQNNLGYDADLFRTTNVLGNGQTSTQVRLSTSGDAYQPGVVTIATDLYAPRITATKTVDQATANLGDTLTYSVAVQNTGQDGATNTTFTDPLPPGVVFVPGSIRLNGAVVTDAPGDDLGEFAGGQVVVRLGAGATAGSGGTLAPGASATVSFQATVATTGLLLGATIENTADLAFSAATTGVPSTVTTAPATTRVNVPDLAIGKTHAPVLQPGVASTYTITVGNVGAGPTSGTVTVTDTIEPGLTINGPVTGAGWSCSTLGTTVTCTHPDVLAPSNEYPPISIPVLVSSSPPAQLSNTASLTGGGDGNPANNSFTDAGAVSEPAIDLHVEKVVTSTPNFTPVGYLFFLDPITYRIEVTNNGVADAANVQLTEILDAPLIVESITPSQGTCSVSPPDCNLGTITAGQAPVTIDIQASAGSQFSPDPWADYPSSKLLNNTATVSAPVGTEINPDDNSASAAISTVPWAETSLTKEFSPAEPVAGGPVTYTLTLHSDGPGTVDMVVADILPDALQKPPTAISISGGTGICQYDPTRENSGFPPGSPIVFCEIPQFGPGEDRVITIEGTLALDSAGTQVDNLGLSSNTLPVTGVFSFEPDLVNNDDLASFTPGAVDLTLQKSRLETGVLPVGQETTFRLVVTNDGTVATTGVRVTDELPAGLTPVGLPAGCTANGQTVTCDVATLGPGAAETFDIRVRAEVHVAEQTLTNLATVTSGDPDVAPASNSASTDVTIGPFSTLSVSKSASASSVPAGTPITYTVVVRNGGPSAAGSINLEEVLPEGLVLRSVTPSQGSCTGTTCDLGDLPAGGTAQVVVVVDTTASLIGRRLVNSVEVTAETPSSPAHAEAPVEITAPRSPQATQVDLAVNVIAPRGVHREGGTARFRIGVVNRGPGTATNVVLTGTTNRGTSSVGAKLLQASCTGLPLRCELGTLAPGQQRTYVVPVRRLLLGRLQLTGSVSASESETTQANNVDRAAIRIQAGRATVRLTKLAGTTSARSGGIVDFTITVRNTGSVPARNLTVCDQLPRRLAFQRLGGARLTNGRACWTISRLRAGGTARYRLSTRVLQVDGTTRVTNKATVQGANITRRTAAAAVTLRPVVFPPFTG